MPERYTEYAYTQQVQTFLQDDLAELIHEMAAFVPPLQEMKKDDIVVAPPAFQVSDAMVWIMGGPIDYPDGVQKSAYETHLGTQYTKYARRVDGLITIQPTVRMLPDASSMNAAAGACMVLTAAIDRILLRHVGEEGWYPIGQLADVDMMLPIVMPGEVIAATRKLNFGITVKEFISTVPQV